MELNHYHRLMAYPNEELIKLVNQIADAIVAEKLGEHISKSEFAMQKADARVQAVLSIPDGITIAQAKVALTEKRFDFK